MAWSRRNSSFAEIENCEGPSHMQELRGSSSSGVPDKIFCPRVPRPQPTPTFAIVTKFRDPAIEAAYQAASLNIKISVDDAWILYSTIVDLLLCWKLGFTLPLVLFAAFSMLMMYLNRLQSGFYKAHRVWLVTAYKLGRAALHASPNMALWWEHRSLSWLPLVGLWNLIFGSKASLLMFQSFGGQINMGADVLLSGVLLAVCMFMTPVNCAECSNSPATSGWMQSCVKVARRVVGAAAGMPDNPDLEYSHNTAAKDCFLMMAFSQVSLGWALPLVVEYYQAGMGRARYASTHKLRPEKELAAQARLLSFSLVCWLSAAWVVICLLSWLLLEALVYRLP